MLSRWLRRSNRLQHADAKVRLQAVLELDDQQASQQEQLLVQMAVKDSALDVRKAALARVTKPNQLAVLLDDDTIAQAAATHIAKLIARGIAAECQNHKQVLAARISQASVTELPGLLVHLSDPQQLADLAIKFRDPERGEILQHPSLHCEQGLSILERTARGRDKFCNRYARDQLEQLKQAKSQCTDSHQRVLELDSAIHKELKHQHQGADELIAQRQKLAKLGSMRAEACATLAQASTALAASGGDPAPFQPATDPLQGVDLFVPDPNSNPFAQMLSELEEMSGRMRSGAAIEQITAQRNTLGSRWLSQADTFPPTTAQHAVFERVSHQYQQYLAAWERLAKQPWADASPPAPSDHDACQRWHKQWHKHLQALHWPDAHQLPAAVETVRQQLEEIQATLAADAVSLKENQHKLAELTQAADDAIAEGHVADATRHLKAARQLYKQTNRDKNTDNILNTLSARLSELRDWQKFATAPKRREFLTQLQTLAEQPLEPAAQAEHLRNLRQQWQQLGPPTSGEDAELQDQFDQLAEVAYAPCKAYYEQQHAQRAENLQQRQAICAQLRTYLSETDWDHAEIKAAESILRTARQAWRSYHPCERKALKPVEAEFEALQEQLHAHIKSAWDKNVAHKKALVAQAQSLLEDDLSAAINTAKTLQQQWRDIGPTPRGVDQRLWREFRQICDQIFARRDADKKAAAEEQSQLRENVEKAIVALEHAAANTPPGAAGQRERQALNDAVDAAAADNRLAPAQQRRVDAANHSYQVLLDKASQQKAAQKLNQWQEWDIAVSRAEDQGLSIPAPDPIFAARLQGEAEQEDWLRLTLTAEIAADLPSPGDNQAERMALQVELMNAGVRQFAPEERQNLLKRWCAAGPKDSEGQALRERFFKAIGA